MHKYKELSIEYAKREVERMKGNPNFKAEYYPNGNISYICYYLNGMWHRKDGPAMIYYYKSGQISSIAYFINGRFHRIDGPAITFYHESGQENFSSYYRNGKQR